MSDFVKVTKTYDGPKERCGGQLDETGKEDMSNRASWEDEGCKFQIERRLQLFAEKCRSIKKSTDVSEMNDKFFSFVVVGG